MQKQIQQMFFVSEIIALNWLSSILSIKDRILVIASQDVNKEIVH